MNKVWGTRTRAMSASCPSCTIFSNIGPKVSEDGGRLACLCTAWHACRKCVLSFPVVVVASIVANAEHANHAGTFVVKVFVGASSPSL